MILKARVIRAVTLCGMCKGRIDGGTPACSEEALAAGRRQQADVSYVGSDQLQQCRGVHASQCGGFQLL